MVMVIFWNSPTVKDGSVKSVCSYRKILVRYCSFCIVYSYTYVFFYNYKRASDIKRW